MGEICLDRKLECLSDEVYASESGFIKNFSRTGTSAMCNKENGLYKRLGHIHTFLLHYITDFGRCLLHKRLVNLYLCLKNTKKDTMYLNQFNGPLLFSVFLFYVLSLAEYRKLSGIVCVIFCLFLVNAQTSSSC